ncbi:MAG: hypothetical protein LBC14_06255 [Desulfovibrio sp.]|nr:hypothetical protein [Desulfovibrio sp.]
MPLEYVWGDTGSLVAENNNNSYSYFLDLPSRVGYFYDVQITGAATPEVVAAVRCRTSAASMQERRERKIVPHFHVRGF